jgi:hypothetical protein
MLDTDSGDAMSATTMQSADATIALLPAPVGAALRAALEHLPGGAQARIRLPDNEGALNHVLLIETPRAARRVSDAPSRLVNGDLRLSQRHVRLHRLS